MSRRAAAITQADLARVLRAAAQAGPEWTVEVIGSVIRLTRNPTPETMPAPHAVAESPSEPDTSKWKL